ncbi:MAG: ABC transporter permease [Candidatus Parvarchaeota archaeon]|nr:ABC transporter permease [Candidatus Rehaiarchaeum fermentans]
MKIIEFLWRRILSSFIVLIGVTLIIYTIYYLKEGLNNYFVGYFKWWSNILLGKWGIINVPMFNGSVLKAISIFLPNTLILLIFSGIIIFLLGIFLGFLSSKHKRFGDLIRIISFFFYSSPSFIIAIFVIIILGVYLGLPYVGSINPILLINANWYSNGVSYPTHILLFDALIHGDFPVAYNAFLHLILPSLSLILSFFAGLLIVMNYSVNESSQKGFYKFLFLRELPNRRRDYHLVKNAVTQPVNFFAYLIASLLSGDVIVETLFSYPGMGLLLVQSLQSSQYIALLDLSLIYSLIFIIVSFILDLIYVEIDPRAEI